jgi:hypothetical protein
MPDTALECFNRETLAMLIKRDPERLRSTVAGLRESMAYSELASAPRRLGTGSRPHFAGTSVEPGVRLSTARLESGSTPPTVVSVPETDSGLILPVDAVKEQPQPVVGEVAKAPADALDVLDGQVDGLGGAIARSPVVCQALRSISNHRATAIPVFVREDGELRPTPSKQPCRRRLAVANSRKGGCAF